MALTELKLRALKANPKPGKHGDSAGLYLWINQKHRMYWQWRIRTPKETEISYGPYPEVSLAEARKLHRTAREQVRQGINPNVAKREAKLKQVDDLTNTFESVAREWHAQKAGEWSPSYADKIIRRLEVDLFPHVGKTVIGALDARTLLSTIRKIEERGRLETAHRALENCGQVFRYGIATGRLSSDPSKDLKGALKRPMTKHMAAILDPKALGGLLRAIDGYDGSHVVRTALRLAPMLMLRPGELRMARWEEIDLPTMTWTIPSIRMKRERTGKLHGDPHIVGLPKQAVELFEKLLPLTGPAGLVFPGERDHSRPMSDNTINAALRRMGFDTQKEVTGHGFRATARTILDEKFGIDVSVIEAQLAHTVSDSLGRAYNRTEFLQQRREMLQAWADYLDGLRKCKDEVRQQ